jgi:hypothetical protein
MDQHQHTHPPTVSDVPRGQPRPVLTQHPVDRRLERSSTVVLRIGVALSVVFVLLPGVGFAAVMVLLASLETWHGGEADMTVESRVQLLSVALLAIGFVVACAVALRRSLRRGWIALALVAIGGLACIYIGVRGIIEATGIDGLITALSWGVAVTGVVLVLGASLGMTARVQASRNGPDGLRRSHGASGTRHQSP